MNVPEFCWCWPGVVLPLRWTSCGTDPLSSTGGGGWGAPLRWCTNPNPFICSILLYASWWSAMPSPSRPKLQQNRCSLPADLLHSALCCRSSLSSSSWEYTQSAAWASSPGCSALETSSKPYILNDQHFGKPCYYSSFKLLGNL